MVPINPIWDTHASSNNATVLKTRKMESLQNSDYIFTVYLQEGQTHGTLRERKWGGGGGAGRHNLWLGTFSIHIALATLLRGLA